LNEALDDQGAPLYQAFRIRQPFDFGGRTGIIAFDLDGQGRLPGGHGYWFDVFIAEEPVPAPSSGTAEAAPYVRAGVGIEFAGGGLGLCPADGASNTVSSFFTEQGYQVTHQVQRNPTEAPLCFTTQPEVLNHFEIHVSTTRIEVFATDAGGARSTLRRVAWVDASVVPELFPLPLTRGYVSFEHLQNGAATPQDPACTTTGCPLLPSSHTYHWDNIGFDGPTLTTVRAYEVPNALSPPLTGTGYRLGLDGLIPPGQNAGAVTLQLKAVDLTGARGASLTLDLYGFGSTDTVGYCFNGCAGHTAWRSFAPPAFSQTDLMHAVQMPLQLGDLRQGDNTLEMRGSDYDGMADAELILDLD
jgi:hypothetical protein